MKIMVRVALAVFLLVFLVGATIFHRPIWVQDQMLHYNLWRAGITGKYAQTSLGKLHYFESDPAKATHPVPVLLVHGLGDRSEAWAGELFRFRAQGFHVYAVDLLGYGASDTPDVDYSIRTQARVLNEFMSVTGISQADVIGWSMGGWVAASLSLDYPKRVRRLALFDSAGIRFETTLTADVFIPSNEDQVHQLVTMLADHPQPMPSFVAEDVVRRLQKQGWVTRRSMNSMKSGADALDNRLGSLTQPTLIVWGAADKLIPVAVGEKMHAMVTGSHFVQVTGCGHVGPSECAGDFEHQAAEFFTAAVPVSGGEEVLQYDHGMTLVQNP